MSQGLGGIAQGSILLTLLDVIYQEEFRELDELQSMIEHRLFIEDQHDDDFDDEDDDQEDIFAPIPVPTTLPHDIHDHGHDSRKKNDGSSSI